MLFSTNPPEIAYRSQYGFSPRPRLVFKPVGSGVLHVMFVAGAGIFDGKGRGSREMDGKWGDGRTGFGLERFGDVGFG